jgi:NADH:ubiquinone oxidoreductase subunit E
MKKAEILRKYKPQKDNILLILHDLQYSNPRQYLTEEDLVSVASYLKMTHGEVYGVTTYYSMFSLKPRGKYIIRICNSPICDILDANKLVYHIKQILNIDIGETTSDDLFTLEHTACIGLCDVAPAMMVNKNCFGNLTAKMVGRIINNLKNSGL